MSAHGVLLALDAATVDRLRAEQDEDLRREWLVDVVEADLFERTPQWAYETDVAWDAIHRSLTDGDLDWDNGTYPLNHVILGGEQLYDENDAILSLKSPEQVREIAAALSLVTPARFKAGYQRIAAEDYDGLKGLEDYHSSWDEFCELPEFYQRAADAGRWVIFSVDL